MTKSKKIDGTWKTIGLLAFTQVLSWGSLYYAIAILGPEIQKEMNWRAEIVIGAFSWSLLVCGMFSTHVGIMLDRYGGWRVMGVGSLVCGCGLIGLSQIHSIASYYFTWTVLGIGMALSLYEAAFATINHHFTTEARQTISTLTFFGGFASTIFWPLTLNLNTIVGWRKSYLIYGVAQIIICLPLHFVLSKEDPIKRSAKTNAGFVKNFTLIEAIKHPTFWQLAFAFSANSFVFSAISVHIIRLLKQFGHDAKFAVMCASFIGPIQAVARIAEKTFAKTVSPQVIGSFSFSALPVALLALLVFSTNEYAVILFCILYGVSNGVSTILKGTIPQVFFGTENYGAISGAMAGPSLFLKAAGPLIIAMIIEHASSSYYITGTLLLFSLASLFFYIIAIKENKVELRSLNVRSKKN